MDAETKIVLGDTWSELNTVSNGLQQTVMCFCPATLDISLASAGYPFHVIAADRGTSGLPDSVAVGRLGHKSEILVLGAVTRQLAGWLIVLISAVLADIAVASSGVVAPLHVDKVEYLVADAADDVTATQLVPSAWQTADSGKIRLGLTAKTIWLRTTVRNNSDHAQQAYVIIDGPRLQHIDIYHAQNGSLTNKVSIGAAHKASQRPIRYRLPTLPLSLKANEQIHLYFAVQSQTAMDFSIRVMGMAEFDGTVLSDNLLIGAKYGGLIIFLVFNLVILIATRNQTVFWFVIFVGFSLVLQMATDGTLGLLSDMPQMAHRAGNFVVGFELVAASMMLRRLLRANQTYIALDRFLIMATTYYLIVGVVAIGPYYTVAQKMLLFSNPVFVLPSIFFAVQVIRKQLLNFSVVVIVATILLGAAVLRSLVLIGSLENTMVVDLLISNSVLALAGALTFIIIQDLIKVMRDREQALVEKLAVQNSLLHVRATTDLFVPPRMLEILGKKDVTEIRLGDQIETHMTSLFVDIKSFVAISETMSPAENANFVNNVYGLFGPIIRRHNGIVCRYIGDAMLCVFPGHASESLAAAIEIRDRTKELSAELSLGQPLDVCIGIHYGNICLAVVGEAQRMEVSAYGDVVNVAARLQQYANEHGHAIIVSADVVNRSDQQFAPNLDSLGERKLKGRREAFSLFAIQ